MEVQLPNVIHMTAAQAASVTGPSPTVSDATLIPAPLTDGTYIVGPEVIADPAFADRRALLQSFPQVDYAVVSAFVPVQVMS